MILPVTGPPIRNGAVLIGPTGRLEAVGPDDAVPHPEGFETLRYPGAALLPGLINVHTHLELTDVGGPIEAPTFYDWLQRIKHEVGRRSRDDMLRSACNGVREAWRFGTTTVADTGRSGATAEALAQLGGRGVVYQEVFGPDPAVAREALEGLRSNMEELADHASDRVKLGVSPHAPYTVSGPLYQGVADLAKREGYPVAAHVAESHAESDLVTGSTGPFANSFARRGITLPPRAKSPVAYLDDLRVLDSDWLTIHCVQTDEADWVTLADHGCAIATCPMSNRFHQHGEPPLQGFREAGIRVGVGTDSVASVGSLSLLRETRWVQDQLSLTSEAALRAITLGGAEILDLEETIGSLDVGKWGDLTVIPVRDTRNRVEEQVIAALGGHVLATFVAGRIVHSNA